MNKLILISIFWGISILSQAQDTQIEPSQQAKSYLESKNIAVDYITGIFHYKVPLNVIEAGNLKLPVTLDYAAKGVKTDDSPGAVGYNWNLNAGGVVIRTVRGGIADETKDKGIINYLPPKSESFPSVYFVNCRYRDGESDIFTAVFGGRTVNFFIRYEDENGLRIEAVPLEPTNVKIECIGGGPHALNGWVITDEEGNIYCFSANETTMVTREGTMETNSINDQYYTSAWYLSTIHTIDGANIQYNYDYGTDAEKTFSRTTIDYRYGMPVIDRPYDFRKYKPEFDQEIQIAAHYLGLDIYATRIQQTAFYNSLEDFYQHASLDEVWPEKIIQNNKTMGILYNLTYVEKAYQEIIGILDDIINSCNRQTSSQYIREALIHLNKAKDIVIACREEINEVWQKNIYLYSLQEIHFPYLRQISYPGGYIEFSYASFKSKFRLLNEVTIRDVNRDIIKLIRLNNISINADGIVRPLLNEISFHDKEKNKVSNIVMNYYGSVDYPYITNIYGYYAKYRGNYHDIDYINKHRFDVTNDDNAAYCSLKTIKIAADAEIELSYETNSCNQSLSGYSYGGIRIGKIKTKDLISGKEDRINYLYDVMGCYVNTCLTNSMTINYAAGFQDFLLFDRIVNTGPDAYIKTGNNGVYYPVVTEHIEGKSIIIYRFIVPGQQDSVYHYWNIGKPLGVSCYNAKGTLQKVIRYEYDDQSALANQRFIDQIKACEYYCDMNYLFYQYGDNPDFVNNIRKRVDQVLPDQKYRISYGYDTYLKRISEYDFDEYTPIEAWPEYLSTSSSYKITEYDYDFSKSTFPVKTTITSSDGSKSIEMVKRALDFDDTADPVIPLLKQKNMVGLPLKVQLKVVESNGVEKLLAERVNKYTGEWPLLTGIYDYRYDGKATERENHLFGFNPEEYEATRISYKCNGLYLPVSIEKQGQRSVYQYDFMTGNVVFETSFVPENSVVACDYRRFKTLYGTPAFELQNAPSLKYKLYVISHRPQPGEISLSVKSSGSVSAHRFIINANDWGPQAFDLDLTALSSIEEISLPDAWKNLVYIALVPVDAEFEARSYNADGSVFCQFDHTGQAQRYEYDAAGRLSRVFDREGNILKEMNYHVVVQ